MTLVPSELVVDGVLDSGDSGYPAEGGGDLSTLREMLAAFPRRTLALGERRHAAVAAVVFPHRGELCFVLTRRAGHLRRHRGQWALPGGRLDAGESPEQAALRELDEELGVFLEPSAVAARLDDYVTRSGFLITPVVLLAEDAPQWRPDANEVSAVHTIAFSMLDRVDCPRLRKIPESDRPVLSIPLLDHWVHAPTAAIVYQLFEAVYRRRVVRVDNVEQPVFAWR